MKVFELLPKPLGKIFRKLTHLTCNSPEVSLQFLSEGAGSARSVAMALTRDHESRRHRGGLLRNLDAPRCTVA